MRFVNNTNIMMVMKDIDHHDSRYEYIVSGFWEANFIRFYFFFLHLTKKKSYQNDLSAFSPTNPSIISRIQKNPIPKKIFKYVKNLKTNIQKIHRPFLIMMILLQLDAQYLITLFYTFQPHHFYPLVWCQVSSFQGQV